MNTNGPESTGSISVLNVGEGDVVVTFNGLDDTEAEKALRMLEDMQKRGYAILVKQPDDTYRRAESIDRETQSYVVVVPDELPKVGEDEAAPAEATKPKRGGRRVRQPIRETHAVGVARSAGG